ncbi:MAG: outer membrane beta-barrel protein [Pseudomonadota bacterium]
MKIKTTFAALGTAAFLVSGAGAALADGHTKYAEPEHYGWEWYVELLAGGPIPNEYDSTVTGLGSIEYDPDSAFGVVGLIGIQFNENWRADYSTSYATAGDGVATGPLIGVVPHSGDVDAWTFLWNVYYEFNDVFDIPLTPWVGAGIGFTVFDYNNLGAAVAPAFVINDSDTAFTGAFHAGFDYELTPNVDLVGRYALILIDSHDVITTTGLNVAADSTVENAFYGGVRIKLGPLPLR